MIHIPKGENLLADYMSRRPHITKGGTPPPSPRSPQALVAVMHEGAMLNMKLIPIIEQANNDQNYQATLIALDEKAIPSTLHPNHPANRYARVWKSLQVFPGPNGRLILYKQGRVVIPDNAIEHTLDKLHQHHASVSEMTETAAMSVW